MRVGIPREIQTGETRIALTPPVVPLLVRDGHEVLSESSAGAAAHFPDTAYATAGAGIVEDTLALYDQADAIFKVQPPGHNLSLHFIVLTIRTAPITSMGVKCFKFRSRYRFRGGFMRPSRIPWDATRPTNDSKVMQG